jgi:molybdopterin converting factor small subunit
VQEQVIHVKVTFLGLLRDQMGVPYVELPLPSGAVMRELFDALAPHVEGKLGEWAWDRGKRDFTSRVIISRGHSAGGREGALIDGEEIVVLPPMAGG